MEICKGVNFFFFKSVPVLLTNLFHLKHVINEKTVEFLVCVIDAQLFKTKNEKRETS